MSGCFASLHVPYGIAGGDIHLLFRYTATLGFRETVYNCYTLERFIDMMESIYGPVRIKHVSGWGIAQEKAECEGAFIPHFHGVCGINDFIREDGVEGRIVPRYNIFR